MASAFPFAGPGQRGQRLYRTWLAFTAARTALAEPGLRLREQGWPQLQTLPQQLLHSCCAAASRASEPGCEQ